MDDEGSYPKVEQFDGEFKSRPTGSFVQCQVRRVLLDGNEKTIDEEQKIAKKITKWQYVRNLYYEE